MKKKICCHSGCNTLIDISERYCSQHKMEQPPPFATAIRFNEELYKTSQWRQLRKEILREQPVCFICGISASLQIHHIIPPRGNEELFFDKNNLTTVCSGCHRLLTAKEIDKRLRER